MTSSLALSVILCAAAPPEPHQRYEYAQMLMGMQFKVVVYASDDEAANRGALAAFHRIQQLNDAFSDYQADSELSLLCQTAGKGQSVPVSEDLLAVLTAAQELSQRSEGAFDVTVGPLTRLWRRSRRSKLLPAADVLAGARAAVGYRHLKLDGRLKTAELKVPRMQLDLGGIAVGYAIDQALDILKREGITSALIDDSGDIGVSAPPPGEEGWKIGVAPLDADASPSRYLLLKHAAVTTSGDAFQFVEIGGKRYSHIVDPHTGLGLTGRTSVTVIARDCTTADSLATAVCVLGPARGLRLVSETPGAEALVVTVENDLTATRESSGFARFENR